jgi:hypothetical protein
MTDNIARREFRQNLSALVIHNKFSECQIIELEEQKCAPLTPGFAIEALV